MCWFGHCGTASSAEVLKRPQRGAVGARARGRISEALPATPAEVPLKTVEPNAGGKWHADELRGNQGWG